MKIMNENENKKKKKKRKENELNLEEVPIFITEVNN